MKIKHKSNEKLPRRKLTTVVYGVPRVPETSRSESIFTPQEGAGVWDDRTRGVASGYTFSPATI